MGAPRTHPESYRLSGDLKNESLVHPRQPPTASFPSMGTHVMWMASSRHSVMQCSSLPQASGRASTAIPSAISKHLTPQTSTQRLQPVHLSAAITGTHLALMVRPSWLASAFALYFTVIVPFIQGCGAHWKCTTPF